MYIFLPVCFITTTTTIQSFLFHIVNRPNLMNNLNEKYDIDMLNKVVGKPPVDAEEDHEAGAAANESAELLVVHHVELGRVQGRPDLVAPRAGGVQVENYGAGDQVLGIIGAGDVSTQLHLST